VTTFGKTCYFIYPEGACSTFIHDVCRHVSDYTASSVRMPKSRACRQWKKPRWFLCKYFFCIWTKKQYNMYVRFAMFA
jgi:hypothetical protein